MLTEKPYAAIVTLAAVGLLLGCAPPGDSESTEDGWDDEKSEIVDGSVANGDPAVVSLTIQGQSFCSGTLITPTVVVTAAHCLPPHVPYSVGSIRVFFGTSVPNGQSISLTDAWVHPGWNQQNQYDDIGLVRLAQAVSTTPLPMGTDPLPQGLSTRVIGFGQSNPNGGGAGTKRHGVMTVDQTDARLIILNPGPSKTCFGDSGGTNTAMFGGVEKFIGINSRSEDCVGIAIETRISGYMANINNFAGTTSPPACGSDGQCATGCSQADPDCPCAQDGFCGACPDPNNDPDCVPCGADNFCDPACGTSDPDCGTGPDCSANGFCEPACNGNDPDCGGEDCSQNGQCNPNCNGSDPDCNNGTPCAASGVCGDCPTGPDPDCWDAGGQGSEDYDDAILLDGCSVTHARTGSGDSPRDLAPAALLLGLLGAVTRRRSSR